LNETIRRNCLLVAQKLKNPQEVAQIALRDENIFMEEISPWDPLSLDYGYPGLIVFFAEMDTHVPNEGWREVYQSLMNDLETIVKEIEPTDFSLFGGFTGVCFATQLIAQKDPSYSKLDDIYRFKLMQYLEGEFLSLIESEEEIGRTLLPSEHDAIEGLPCFVFYLLAYQDNSDVRELLERMLYQLVRVAKDISVENCKIPGWYVNLHDSRIRQAVPKHIVEDLLKNYPNGFFETGLAHGISGCLAALAKALSCQVEVEGQREAMYKIIRWLQQSQEEVEGLGNLWTKRLGLNLKNPNFVEVRSTDYFDGWAHGAPGILNSLLLAACALKDHALVKECKEGLFKMMQRIRNHHTSRGLPFCYGLAGVLTIVHNAGVLLGNESLLESAREISEIILKESREEAAFGFKSIAPSNRYEEILLIDNPGLLTGSAGITLSLLFSISKRQPRWLSIFLLN